MDKQIVEKKSHFLFLENISLVAKVGILTFVFFIVAGYVLITNFNKLLSEQLIDQTQRLTEDFIQNEIFNQLEPLFFSRQILLQEQSKLTKENLIYFNHVLNIDDIVKVKIWDNQATSLFSLVYGGEDNFDIEIVNEQYPDNERYKEAFGGKTNLDIKPPISPENIREVGYGQMMEVYIPVYLDKNKDGDPVGVVEIYYSMDELNSNTKHGRNIITVSLVLSFGLLYLLLLFITWRVSGVVSRQNKELRVSRKQLSKQTVDLEKIVKQRTLDLQKKTEELEAYSDNIIKQKEVLEEKTTELKKKAEELEKVNKLMVDRELKMVELKKKIEKIEK